MLIADEPADTPEEEAVNRGGEHNDQGDRDQAHNPQCETPDDGGGAVVPTVLNENNFFVDEEEVLDVDGTSSRLVLS